MTYYSKKDTPSSHALLSRRHGCKSAWQLLKGRVIGWRVNGPTTLTGRWVGYDIIIIICIGTIYVSVFNCRRAIAGDQTVKYYYVYKPLFEPSFFYFLNLIFGSRRYFIFLKFLFSSYSRIRPPNNNVTMVRKQ